MIDRIRRLWCEHDFEVTETIPRGEAPPVVFGYHQNRNDYTPVLTTCTTCGATQKQWCMIEHVHEQGLEPKHEYQTKVTQYD